MRSACLNRSEKKKGDKMEEFTLSRSRPEEEKRIEWPGPVRKPGKMKGERDWDRAVSFHTLSDNSDFVIATHNFETRPL